MSPERAVAAVVCREDERMQRIKAEGYDRYAPPSDTNRRPDGLAHDDPTRSVANA